MTPQTIAVSFVNVYGFCVVTTHYSAGSVRLRLAELGRAGIEGATVSGDMPQPERNARRSKGARKSRERAA